MNREEAIQHAVLCPSCGNPTYKFEKYCHRCGANRWEAKENDELR